MHFNFRASKISVDVKVQELRTREISLIHREKMIEEEREELYGRISKLTADLESAESKSLTTHSFHLQLLAQLQADVDNKTKQLKLEVEQLLTKQGFVRLSNYFLKCFL